MSRYRKVLTRIWQDGKFLALPDDGKLLFQYHLTSPQSTPFLLYLEGLGSVGDVLGFATPRLKRAADRLSSDGMVRYGREGSLQWVFLPNAMKIDENAPPGANACTSYVRLFGDLPATPFRHAAVMHWRSLNLVHKPTLAFFDAISYANGYDIKNGCLKSSCMPSGDHAPAGAVAVAVAGEGEGAVAGGASRGARPGSEVLSHSGSTEHQEHERKKQRGREQIEQLRGTP